MSEYEEVIVRLDKANTIIEEIVRCKDCRWYKDFDGCFFSTAEVEPLGYCSYGERKTEEESIREVARGFMELVDATADRKTEPSSSENPNSCKVKNYCDDCLYTDTCDSKEFFYACTSKATISKMEQVEDEPQTDCPWK